MIPSMLESIQTRFRQVFYLDLRMLACFRIGLGALTLWDLGCRAGSFKAHYGSSGVLPPNEASLYADFNTLIPFHLWFTSDIQQACLFFMHGLAAIALILGIKTRWTTIICWLLLNSLHIRNPVVLYGADRQLAALFFWAMFLPLGARWSFDMKQRLEWQGKIRIEGWFCAGLILQIAIIYFTSAWSKSGASWYNGTAVWFALNIDNYTSDLGRTLLRFPILLSALTYGTLLIEWVAPLLMLGGPYVILRRVGCWLLISLQIGFLVFMDLGLFPLVSILALVAILPVWKSPHMNKQKNTLHSNSLIGKSVAAFFVLLMLIWQVALVRHQFRSNSVLAIMPNSIQWLLKTTRLAQSWSMFSPSPPDTDGWFILEYTDSNEENVVDLLKQKAPLTWEKTSAKGSILDSDRWKEWFNKIHTRSLSWEQTIHFFQKKYTSIDTEGTQEYAFQLRLWFLVESARNPEQPPERHLLFERLQPTATSDH
jgi:hypothetical protein